MKDKSIDALYDKFYANKKKKLGLKCLDCGKRFSKKVSPTDTTRVKCPKCGTNNVDIF